MSEKKTIISVGTASEVFVANAMGRIVKHTPPPTGQLPEFFSGSTFDVKLHPVEPSPVKEVVTVPRDLTSFEVDKVADKGTSISGTQAFLSKSRKR